MNIPSAQGFACCSKIGFVGGILVWLFVWRRGGGVGEFQDLVLYEGEGGRTRRGRRGRGRGGRALGRPPSTRVLLGLEGGG